jgi:quercetin dioxygenase-like cupin family protein
LGPYKVDFQSIAWEHGRPGVHFKVYCEGSRQIRLVEFATSEGDPHWRELGHIGYVLEGGLDIKINGEVFSIAAGDGLFIPPGDASAHRGVCITPGTRLLMVEDR